MKRFAPIVMGSKGDKEFAEKIIPGLKEFGIEYELRIASAHKHPEYVLGILREYDVLPDTLVVYVAVAGRQHALAPTMAANTIKPVIACYPDSKANEDILSSLHSPKGVTIYPVLYPENVGIAAAKIMALGDADLNGDVEKYISKLKQDIEDDDKKLREIKM